MWILVWWPSLFSTKLECFNQMFFASFVKEVWVKQSWHSAGLDNELPHPVSSFFEKWLPSSNLAVKPWVLYGHKHNYWPSQNIGFCKRDKDNVYFIYQYICFSNLLGVLSRPSFCIRELVGMSWGSFSPTPEKHGKNCSVVWKDYGTRGRGW